MSNYTKRKHYQNQILGQEITELADKQSIVKIIKPKGNNLHQVESGTGEMFLMSMPNKFRKAVYVKVGDFVLVESIDEGDKVRAEMVNIIDSDDIPMYVKNGIWPERFNYAYKGDKKDDYNLTDLCDDELVGNVNRPNTDDTDSESDSCESSDDENDN